MSIKLLLASALASVNSSAYAPEVILNDTPKPREAKRGKFKRRTKSNKGK